MNAQMLPFHCQAYPLPQLQLICRCQYSISSKRSFRRNLAESRESLHRLSNSDTNCYVVTSKSSDCPHIIKRSKSGQFSSESSCLMWQNMCTLHCCCRIFTSTGRILKWFKSSKTKPNLSKLSNTDVPKGRGKTPKKEN